MKLAYLFLTTLLLLNTANASTAKDVEALSVDDHKIYYATAAMCEGGSTRDYAEKAKLWVNSINESALMTSAFQLRSPLHVSPDLENMISSMGFHLALKKCYGDNERKKELFFYSLLSLDISGKLTSWALDITLLKSLYFGVEGIYAAGFAPSPQRWTWFRFFFQKVINQPLLWKITPTKLSLAYIASQITSEIYLKKVEARDQMNLMSGATPEKIESLQEEIQFFKIQMSQSSDPKEIQLYQLFIKQNQEQIAGLLNSQKK